MDGLVDTSRWQWAIEAVMIELFCINEIYHNGFNIIIMISHHNVEYVDCMRGKY